MADVETPKAPTDISAHMKAFNEREEAQRSGKPIEKTPTPVVTPAADKPVEENAPRALRRENNSLREKAAAAEARAQLMQEMFDKGLVKPTEAAKADKAATDPEPLRKDFANDADYYRACGKWDARQEAAKAVSTIKEERGQEEQLNTLKSELAEASKFHASDIKDVIGQEDWDKAIAKAAEDVENGLAPEYKPADHQMFHLMLMRSEMGARLMHYLAQNPEDFQKLLDMTKTPDRQIAAFHRLEGRMETLYAKKDPVEKETPVDRDAGKAKPSESASVKVGSATDGGVPRFLEDGKTMNPAYLAKRSAELGFRQ